MTWRVAFPPIEPQRTGAARGLGAEAVWDQRWTEKVDRNIHPHIKPIGLIARLIGAPTQPGDMIIDLGAGSFIVMKAAHQLGRNFIGCDLNYQGANQ